MATLAFNGSSHYLGGVGQGAMNGAQTVAVLLRRTTTSGGHCMVSPYAASGCWAFELASGDRPQLYNDNTGTTSKGNAATQLIIDTDWWVVAFTRAAASSTPRFHVKNITDPGSWVHEPGDIALATDPDAATNVDVGRFNLPGAGIFDFFQGEFGLVGWWNAALSDAHVEDLADNSQTSDWHTNAGGTPASLTELTSTSPTDLEALVTWTNNGATLTGTNPTGWTFDGTGSLAPVPPSNPPLGGDVTENTTGGIYDQALTGGVVAEYARGGVHDESTRSGSFDESLTGGEVL